MASQWWDMVNICGLQYGITMVRYGQHLWASIWHHNGEIWSTSVSFNMASQWWDMVNICGLQYGITMVRYGQHLWANWWNVYRTSSSAIPYFTFWHAEIKRKTWHILLLSNMFLSFLSNQPSDSGWTLFRKLPIQELRSKTRQHDQTIRPISTHLSAADLVCQRCDALQQEGISNLWHSLTFHPIQQSEHKQWDWFQYHSEEWEQVV